MRPLDARVKIGLALCAGLLAISLEGPLPLALLVALVALPVLHAPAARGRRLRGLAAILALVWSMTLSQALFYGAEPRVPLLDLGPVVLYREGARHGLVQSMRFVAVALTGIGLALRTPPDRLLAALARIGVPYGLCFLASTALRFVPVAGRELLEVRRARRRRGRPILARAPWSWLALEVALLGPVVARSLRRARSLAESLDARGFDARSAATLSRAETLSPAALLLLACCGGLTLLVLGTRLALYVAEAFYHPSLRPLYGLVRSWL
jgi:energy-coupling factor transport system permease protein